MSGFSVESGEIVITNGSRTVQTTDGTMVNLLPGAYDVNTSATLAFPDFTKDYGYNWWFTVQSGGGSMWGLDEGCTTVLTIPAQEYQTETVLQAVPAGMDFFLARIRLTQTVAPTAAWAGSAVTPLPITGQWMPFSGSVLMEAEIGMARAMSIYIKPNANPALAGELVLHKQQSVSTPPGGFGAYGSSPTGFGARTGGEWVVGSTGGIPVLVLDQRDTAPVISPNSFPSQQYRIGNVNACGLSSFGIGYASTYTVEIQGAFGRRS